MSLSCSCDSDHCEWYYTWEADFTVLSTSKRKRCCSCKKLIDIGSEVIKLERWRDPLADIEEDICGTDVWLAPWWLCSRCAEILLNLNAIGYCYIAGDSLPDMLRDYWEMTGFEPEKYKGAQP